MKAPILSDPVREFYRAVLRLMLVLHHDFPEFIADHHFRLCAALPAHCVQLRNLVISTYPAAFPDMPDPFTAGLKVDRLEEMRRAPTVRADIEGLLQRAGVKDALDALLWDPHFTTDRSVPENEVSSVDSVAKIANPHLAHIVTTAYSVQGQTGFAHVPSTADAVLLQAVALYICTTAVNTSSKGTPFAANSPPVRVLEALARVLGPEARYHFVGAVISHLRYPNSHTHWFSYALLHLFALDGGRAMLQEIATRVLLERLLVHRPHPWGLIVTLLELLKNPAFRFWDLPFVKSSAEVSWGVPCSSVAA